LTDARRNRAAIANKAVDIDFDVVNGEERWTSIGHTEQLRILVVVWTMREESIRPVTAFEADKRLAKEYLAKIGLYGHGEQSGKTEGSKI